MEETQGTELILNYHANMLDHSDAHGLSRRSSKSGMGMVLSDATGKAIYEFGGFFAPGEGTTTRLVEYRALIFGLSCAIEFGATALNIISASPQLVKQMEGTEDITDARVRGLWIEASRLKRHLSSCEWASQTPPENDRARDLFTKAITDSLKLEPLGTLADCVRLFKQSQATRG